MKNHTGKLIIGAAVLLLLGSFAYAGWATQGSNEGVVVTEHVKGNPDAAVTLTEYSDFQCPACGQFYPVVKELVAQYENELRFEYKHFPLTSIHPFAIPAARAAEAAGQQDAFFEYHDLLFENQSVWSNSANPTAYFNGYAEELGLDIKLFKQHMRAPVLSEKVQAEFAEARELGLTSTPTFFLNGERMQFSTFEEFLGAIDEAINGPAATSTDTVAEPASDVTFGL